MALDLPNKSESLRILTDVIGLIAPIMLERGFQVRSLREFLPRGTRLLGRNWNRGDVIEVRLRVSRSDKLTYVSPP